MCTKALLHRNLLSFVVFILTHKGLSRDGANRLVNGRPLSVQHQEPTVVVWFTVAVILQSPLLLCPPKYPCFFFFKVELRTMEVSLLRIAGGILFAGWNTLASNHAHAIYACQCALAMKAKLAALKIPFKVHIAINTDTVLVGNIGTAQATSYNMIGSCVNICFILARLNLQLCTSILLSTRTFMEVQHHFVTRGVDYVEFDAAATRLSPGMWGPWEGHCTVRHTTWEGNNSFLVHDRNLKMISSAGAIWSHARWGSPEDPPPFGPHTGPCAGPLS